MGRADDAFFQCMAAEGGIAMHQIECFICHNVVSVFRKCSHRPLNLCQSQAFANLNNIDCSLQKLQSLRIIV